MPPADPVNDQIRERLRSIRKQKGLSIREAAFLTGIPESSYSCLENGFYRISLLNLQRMLTGLGVDIVEVWPSARGNWSFSQDRATWHPEARDSFRFTEIVHLTRAPKGALALRRERDWSVLYGANLLDRDQEELLECLASGLHRRWTVYGRASDSVQIALCLWKPRLQAHVEKLIDTYLEHWLAVQLSAPSPPAGSSQRRPD